MFDSKQLANFVSPNKTYLKIGFPNNSPLFISPAFTGAQESIRNRGQKNTKKQ